KLCDVGATDVTLLKADGKIVHVEQDRLLASGMDFVAELLAFIENGGDDAEPADLPGEFDGKVVAVTDGDTIGVMHNGREVKIRLEAIDAPERSQPFGSDAKQALSNAVFGKEVTIKVTGKDR